MTVSLLPSPEIVAWLVRQFGVDPAGIERLPDGEANLTWALGDDLVLRVPRNGGELSDDLRKERLVIPVARSAGVQTPAVVAFKERVSEVGIPLIVLHRVAGTDLDRAGLSESATVSIYREAGRQIALLHAATGSEFNVPAGVPRDEGGDDPRSVLEQLVVVGALDRETATSLCGWFDRLAPFIPVAPAAVLIHGDLAPRNLMVDPASGAFRAVIDWGDAARADPATDFAKLPLVMLPAVLEGYLGTEGRDDEAFRSWLARAFRYQLHWAVAAIGRRDPENGALRTPGPAMGRLMVILRFFIETTDQRWRWLW